MDRKSTTNAEGETNEMNSSRGSSNTIKVSYILLYSCSSKFSSNSLATLTVLFMANSKLYVSNGFASQLAYVTIPLP